MKAVFFNRHGGADVLEYGDLPTPVPSAGEALVRVKACGLNHLDLWLRKGRDIPLPHVPGSDVSGVIERINGTATLPVGTEVTINPAIPCGSCPRCKANKACETVRIFGAATWGGYAEYVTVPLPQLFAKPEHLSFVEAAAFPLTFLTAWHMLGGRAQLRHGESVFIWGASGALGTAAMQIASYLGARIIGAAKSEQVGERLRQLGAHEVIMYTQEDVVERVKALTDGIGADVVFESVGEKTWQQSIAMLRPNGRLVIAGATSGERGVVNLSDLYVRQLSILGARMGTREEFEEVLRLVASGDLKPVVDSTFPLSEAAKAQERMEKGRHIGKIVLEVKV